MTPPHTGDGAYHSAKATKHITRTLLLAITFLAGFAALSIPSKSRNCGGRWLAFRRPGRGEGSIALAHDKLAEGNLGGRVVQ